MPENLCLRLVEKNEMEVNCKYRSKNKRIIRYLLWLPQGYHMIIKRALRASQEDHMTLG